MTAEFKISRLKYTWKGHWQIGTIYNPDDIISVGGKVYNCLERHAASSNFYTDLEFVNTDVPPLLVPKWELIADGVSFRNNWTTNTYYLVGDIVRHGGTIYISLEQHTSQLSQDDFNLDRFNNSYWAVLLTSNDWQLNWTVDTLYKLGDLVRYNGIVYECTENHRSTPIPAAGLLVDLTKWKVVVEGIVWRSNWLPETLYLLNDVVRYGGIVYRCTAQHISSESVQLGLEIDLTNWVIVHSGVEFLGLWTSNTRYKLNDVVKFENFVYQCVTPHSVLITDSFDLTKWTVFCPGQEYQTVWNSTSIYTPGDIVRHGGYLFVSDTFNANSTPEYDQSVTNSNWSLLFKGTKIRGEYSLTESYQTGDLVKRKGQLYVAKTNVPAGQDTDVISDGSSINEPYWDLFIPGVEWTAGWLERNTYLLGDLAFWRGRTYKCVVKHIADNDNRPDQNIGSVWEPYTYGNPENVLSFVGDLKYFGTREDGSSIGTTNLVAGNSSQVLVAGESNLSWADFNFSNSVYYVSLNGQDSEFRGTTLNAAWRTLRYALENITGPATVFLKSGTYEEILPLIIPPNVAVVGEELRGVTISPVENFYTQTDINRYENFLNYLQTIVPLIVQGHIIGTDNPSSPAFGTTLYGEVAQTLLETSVTSTEVTKILILLSAITSFATSNAGTGLVGSNERVSIVSNEENAASIMLANKNFISSEIKGWLTNFYPEYNYNSNQIEVDVIRILNAVAYDLRYPGTYKSIQVGKLFNFGSNAFDNKRSNMFLLQDGTGIRNCTLIGLTGELSPLNANLTRRPTAGAYASLDPGWGPNDTFVQVGNRSPYIQNVTTFGTGCVGLKVDGSLHAAGNKTIVANDFTQILSDGIGVWCNASGGTEVVSVFTYYNHIGYLCTDGGKIRGTNGNCSYGQYGAVSEGFDGSEIPIIARVNNRFFGATVVETFSSNGEILRLFFNHAGQDYTSATFSTTGAGINAAYIADEFRSRSISEARLVDPGDSSTPGGSGYTLNINNAQSGGLYTITLASSDGATPAEYRGLRIVLQTGTGSGQFGYIADYNGTSKIVYIAKEYYDTIDATATLATGNLITLDTTDNLYVDDAILFTGTTIGGVSTETIYYITSIIGNDITVSLSIGGSDETLLDDTGSMTLHKSGWENFQGGRTIEPILDTTTSYYVEPRIYISKPDTSDATVNLGISSSWKTIVSLDGTTVILANGSPNGTNITRYSTDNVTWIAGSSLPTAQWTSIAAGDGKFVAVSFGTIGATSTNGSSWTEIALPTGQYNSVAYGNENWIAVGYGTSGAKSTDGSTWSSSTLPEGAEWSSVAYGKGKFVAVAASDSTITNTAYTVDNGDSWTLGSFAGGCKSIAYGNNRFVAISGGYAGADDCFISFDGISWTPANIPAANWQSITYGEGLFVAVADGENFVITSQDGVNWSKIEIDSTDTYTAVAFSKRNGIGKFYITASGSLNLVELSAGARALARISLNSNRISTIKFWENGSGYISDPTATVYDPNNSFNAVIDLRISNGVLGNPTILNPGTGYVSISSSTSIVGDGFKDEYQIGRFLIVEGANRIPGPGDNLNIQGINDYTYKVLRAEIVGGTVGNYQLRLSIAKNLNAAESPEHLTTLTIRQKYSQVRLTGHDFLDIGLGNFEQTNYPNTLFPNGTILAPEDETKESDGGRVFYTSTDQDGNFRVGELFAVEQASGTVTISADFFQLEGLEEIAIGGVSVGGSGVVVREFSTDPFFIADSNNIIPTQRAIKEFLARRVSGGGSDAFTGQFTAGVIRVGPRSITTTTGDRIDIPVAVKFTRPVSGTLLAHSLFMAGAGDGMQES